MDVNVNVKVMACVAYTMRAIDELHLPADNGVAHMLSIGGWGAPHPSTTLTGGKWWAVFRDFNSAWQQQYNMSGFMGIDWDLEGNNDHASEWNTITLECLDLVGTMSQAAKSDGFLVGGTLQAC